MISGIDHLVIAVRDVAAAEAELAAVVGIACTGGGRHEAMGTFNRLAFLGDTYLELIGVFSRELVVSSTTFAVGNAALAHLESGREGLATYALATDDVRGDAARLRAAGSLIDEPVDGARRRPDGETVRWTTAFPPLGPDRPPFLIEHEMAGAEWGDAARAARAAFRHPAGGAVRLEALELPVADATAAAREYGTTLGIAFSEGWRTSLGAAALVLRRVAMTPAPVIRLKAEPGTPPLDVLLFGIRWVRAATTG